MKKRVLASALAAVMIATLLVGCTAPSTTNTTTTTPTTTGVVTTEPILDAITLGSGNTGFVYIPVSAFPDTRSCTSPIFIILGDKNYTEATARATAESSRLAEVAASQGGVLLFINSLSGTWTDEDAAFYQKFGSIIKDSTEFPYINGKYDDGEKVVYGATRERSYIFAEGSGADFVAQHNLFGPAETGTPNMSATSVTLFNLSAIPELAPGAEIPIVTVNAPDGIEAQLQAVSPSGFYQMETSNVTEGFDGDIIAATYSNLTGAYRRENGVLIKVPDYAALGITETRRTETLSWGEAEYFEYIPNNLDMTKPGTVPLVMIFHGNNNHAQYQAWASEWPIIGLQNGFMVVSVNGHVDKSSDDMVVLLEALETKYPAIDKTRIYASGFSMGGAKSWNLGLKHPELFAGIMPMDLGLREENSTTAFVEDTIIPTFYLAGGASGLDERPSQKGTPNEVDQVLSMVFKANGVTDAYAFDAAAGVWGLTPDSTVSIPNTTFTDCTLDISYYKSGDGNTYTALCNAVNKAHAIYAADSYAAWDFIRQFSRNSDGTITITP